MKGSLRFKTAFFTIMDLRYIVVEGNIGVGKTSLCKLLAKDYNAELFLERFKENNFLGKFYDEPERYAFQLELSFLIDRYKQLVDELMAGQNNKLTIADYHYSKSLIFSNETLKKEEFVIYKQIFNLIFKENIIKPDIFVFLKTGIDKLAENIKKRGRVYEKNISLTYLHKIQQGYLSFIRQQNDIPCLVFDVGSLDFVENQEDYKKIKDFIFKNEHKKGITNVCF